MNELRIRDRTLAIVRGDITRIAADAIVRHCPTGSAVVTGAGDLPARWVIHAVGPVWHGGGTGEAELLVSAYRTSCQLARDLGAGTITFPAISTGVYCYPMEQAAGVALTAVRDHLAGETTGETTLERATFVLYSADSLAVFERALSGIREGVRRGRRSD